MIEKRYSFIVYYFNQEKEELQILESYVGKNNNNLEYENINCFTCTKNKAIAYFEMELLDKIYIVGKLETTGEIELQEIYIT